MVKAGIGIIRIRLFKKIAQSVYHSQTLSIDFLSGKKTIFVRCFVLRNDII